MFCWFLLGGASSGMGGGFGQGYGGGYGGGAMKNTGYSQRATGPYGGLIVFEIGRLLKWTKNFTDIYLSASFVIFCIETVLFYCFCIAATSAYNVGSYCSLWRLILSAGGYGTQAAGYNAGAGGYGGGSYGGTAYGPQ